MITEESQHDRDLRAERTLLSITLNMNEKELLNFLNEYGIEIFEYNLILSKHSRIIERLKEETKK